MNRREMMWGALCLPAACSLRAMAETRAQRIVSTAPSITEALFALGLGARVVGVSKYCDFPAEVKLLPRVGSYLHPDAEAIARLTPDLVFVQRSSNELSARLSGLKITVVDVPHGTLADVYRGIEIIAGATQVLDRGVALNARIREQLLAVQKKAKAMPAARVLVVLDRKLGTLNDLTALGPDNYVNELVVIAGGDNVLKGQAISYPKISLETVLRENPDVIVDLSGERDTEEERRLSREASLTLWRQYGMLAAVRQNRVYVGTSNALLVPGPRSVDAAELLFRAMHGAGA